MVDDGSEQAFGASVIDRHIDPSEACDGVLHQHADFGFEAYVGKEKNRLGAERTQFGGQSLASLFVTAADNHARLFLGEGNCGGAADAGERASDEDDGMIHVNSLPMKVRCRSKRCNYMIAQRDPTFRISPFQFAGWRRRKSSKFTKL